MLIDSINSLASDEPEGYVVTRRTAGVFNADGELDRTGVATTTFTIHGTLQPATGLARVVGGQDMRQDAQGNRVNDIRHMFTETKLYAQDDQSGHEPDLIAFEGRTYTVFRVEKWELSDVYYHVTFACQLGGGS